MWFHRLTALDDYYWIIIEARDSVGWLSSCMYACLCMTSAREEMFSTIPDVVGKASKSSAI